MNESILTQLKTLVERAVRPVRASTSRKRKMREELLAHVTAVFEEEANLSGAAAALERVAVRFGDAATLARQLQETVPLEDRVSGIIESLVGLYRVESTLRRAIRHAAVVCGMCIALAVIIILVSADRSQSLTRFQTRLFAPVMMAFLTFSFTLIASAMRQALFGSRGRSWLLAALTVGVSWLFVPATQFAFCLAFTGQITATFRDMLPSVSYCVLVPMVLAFLVYWSNAEIRYEQEWASLKID